MLKDVLKQCLHVRRVRDDSPLHWIAQLVVVSREGAVAKHMRDFGLEVRGNRGASRCLLLGLYIDCALTHDGGDDAAG